ncbi:MAG: response regulator [candidate division Zixibacteria bacterium]|nr:response regulator [candidate division Zixibacteria bacterium]
MSLEQGPILVMDDEPDIRELCYEILTDLGYHVECVAGGADAIKRYREEAAGDLPFHVVLLDVTVKGGMGGREALQKLREIDPSIKAVVSSGYSADPVMIDYRALGFRGLLRKPFDFVEMGNTVDRLIREES